MTEPEWLAASDPAPMLTFALGKTSERKLRLVCCGCCRRAWSLLPENPTRTIVEAVERFADGKETGIALGRLRRDAARTVTRWLRPHHLATRKVSERSLI